MNSTRTNASMLCINITPKFVRIRRGVALSTNSSLRCCRKTIHAERGTQTQRLLNNQKLIIDSSTSDASMGSHFGRRVRRHFSSPFDRVSEQRRHTLVTSASSNNNNIVSAGGFNSSGGGQSRLRAINNPSQQQEQQGLADALAVGKSASPPGSSRGQEELKLKLSTKPRLQNTQIF